MFGEPESAIQKEMKTYELLMEAKDGTDLLRTAPEQVENLVIMKCNLRLLREMKTSL